MASSSVGFRGLSITRACGLALACCATIATVGCGKTDDRVAVYPVSGKVLVKGQPAAGATVILNPAKPIPNVGMPRATVASDGTFKAYTYETGDGAPEGEYKVTVLWYKPKVINGVVTQSDQNVVPAKYASPDTTPEVARVTAGPSNSIPDIIIQ